MVGAFGPAAKKAKVGYVDKGVMTFIVCLVTCTLLRSVSCCSAESFKCKKHAIHPILMLRFFLIRNLPVGLKLEFLKALFFKKFRV